MRFRLSFLLLVAGLAAFSAAKKTGTAAGENDDMTLTATLYTDPADIKNLVGSDLDGHYFVADVKIQPKYGKTVDIDRDQFLLRCFDGNDTSRPFVGSQIADKSTLVVGKVMEGDGKKARPRITLGGMGAQTGGEGQYDNAPAKVKENSDASVSPLEKTLNAKMLREGKTDQPVGGLLYFAMEKHKLKDMELTYGPKDTRIAVHFK